MIIFKAYSNMPLLRFCLYYEMLFFRIMETRWYLCLTIPYIINYKSAAFYYFITSGVESLRKICQKQNIRETRTGIFCATAQKMKLSIKDFFTCTEEVVNGKLYFKCSENPRRHSLGLLDNLHSLSICPFIKSAQWKSVVIFQRFSIGA